MQVQDMGAPGQSRARTLRPTALAATPLPMGLQWGLHAPRTQRGPRLEQQPEVALADVASPSPEDEEDFLVDPGAFTAADLAFHTAEPFGHEGHVRPLDPANALDLIDEDLEWLEQLLTDFS